jgi:hypothetical protein
VLDPRFTISRFRVNAPSDDPTFLAKRERVYEGMRSAGVPEVIVVRSLGDESCSLKVARC